MKRKKFLNCPMTLSPYVFDNFYDVDATLLSSHPITINKASTVWTALRGVYSISGNKAKITTDASALPIDVTCDTGKSDCTLSVIVNLGADAWYGGLAVRASDVNNMFEVYGASSNDTFNPNTLGIVQNAGGVRTARATGSVTIAFNTNYLIQVILSGTNITGYVNGVQICTYSSPTNQNVTKHGLWGYGLDATNHSKSVTWSNFKVT